MIGPWNYPLTNSFGDCIPALAAGNSVILKPSEVTPLTSLLLAEGLRECGLPDGVFQVATGRGATGAALIEQVDMIMFTGSTRTGRKVAAAAAERLIPCSLELGGKDPMIVLSDADLERAANIAVYYSMQNAGQTCISIERVYVEAPVYDEFVGKVTEKMRKLRVGALRKARARWTSARSHSRRSSTRSKSTSTMRSTRARACSSVARPWRTSAGASTSRRCSWTWTTR